jgi:hypothetical protein
VLHVSQNRAGREVDRPSSMMPLGTTTTTLSDERSRQLAGRQGLGCRPVAELGRKEVARPSQQRRPSGHCYNNVLADTRRKVLRGDEPSVGCVAESGRERGGPAIKHDAAQVSTTTTTLFDVRARQLAVRRGPEALGVSQNRTGKR